MKNIKKISLLVVVMVMSLVIVGCGNKATKEETGNNFTLKYDSEKAVDKVTYKIDGMEYELNPMNEDTKVKKGYMSNIVMPEEEFNLSLEVIENGEVIYKIEDSKIDLTEGKRVEISIVDGNDGTLESKVVNN